MVSFTASLLQDKKVKLDWSTSMEINCSKYKIERSFDGNIFNNVANVSGSGTTSLFHSYSFTDDVFSATGSIVYYRIQQLDFDGKGSYSKVLPIKFKNENRQVIISPNPFSNYLNINIEWNKNEIIVAKVINTQGGEVVSKNIQMSKGLNYISIDELSKLPSGNYFIQFISGTERFTQKITKQ
jgi:hypothetical protein